MTKLTPNQQRLVSRARALAAAIDNDDRSFLAAELRQPADTPPEQLRAYALGAASARMAWLVEIIDELTGGQP